MVDLNDRVQKRCRRIFFLQALKVVVKTVFEQKSLKKTVLIMMSPRKKKRLVSFCSLYSFCSRVSNFVFRSKQLSSSCFVQNSSFLRGSFKTVPFFVVRSKQFLSSCFVQNSSFLRVPFKTVVFFVVRSKQFLSSWFVQNIPVLRVSFKTFPFFAFRSKHMIYLFRVFHRIRLHPSLAYSKNPSRGN